MTTLTWRQQAMAAFLSAQDGLRRVTGVTSGPALAPLDAALDVAEPLIIAAERQRITRAILAQQQPCREHPHPFPKPSCWTCARNGAFHRAAVIASQDTDPDGMPAGWAAMHEEFAAMEREKP